MNHLHNTELQKFYQRYKSDRCRAQKIEAAFHEAGHAVMTLLKGGGIYGLEIHWTPAEQQKYGAWGSCGTRGIEGTDDAMASLAGPIAAQQVTGFLRKGDDFAMAAHVLGQVDQEHVALSMQVRREIEENWSSVERVAEKLLSTASERSPTRFNTSDIAPLLAEGYRTAAQTLDDIPEAIRTYWTNIAGRVALTTVPPRSMHG